MTDHCETAAEQSFSKPDHSLAEWLADAVERLREGGPFSLDTLAAEHPERAEKIRQLIPAIELMARQRIHHVQESVGKEPLISAPQITGSLGDFRISRVIGHGGMGVVYEALQVSLNRRVALKILPLLAADDPRKLKRFQVEAQAAACLHHPHIVPVFAVGCEGGLHYFAMQLIEGLTLAEVVTKSRQAQVKGSSGWAKTARAVSQTVDDAPRSGSSPDDLRPGDQTGDSEPRQFATWAYSRGRTQTAPDTMLEFERPSPRMVAELGRQAADALHFAHEHGILHRDVKPSNLLVNASGWLWVADFGLARITGEVDQTATGDLLGTLRYMSPEQAFGSRAMVDQRTDVYSLGATLYEVLTLRPVFEGDERLALLRRIVDEEPRPPRRIDPFIPRDLEAIVMKALAKEPAHRYATARELADDLERFLDNRPVLARSARRLDKVAQWSRRNRRGLLAVGLLVMLLIPALAGAALWRHLILSRHNDALKSAFDRVNSALDLARRGESFASRLSYSAEMNRAQQAWAAGDTELAQELLEKLRPQPEQSDPRGFDWYLLRQICQRDVSLLSSHDAPVHSMAISPDGHTVVTSDFDGVLIFWDLPLGIEKLRLPGRSHPGSCLCFSPDGKRLALKGSREGEASEVVIWDLGPTQRMTLVPDVKGQVRGMSFSPDGRTLTILEDDIQGDWARNRLLRWNSTEGTVDVTSLTREAQPLRGGDVGGMSVQTNEASKASEAPCRDENILEGRSVAVEGLASVPGTHVRVGVHRGGSALWDRGSIVPPPLAAHHEVACLMFSDDGNAVLAFGSQCESFLLVTGLKSNPRQVALEGISGNDFHFVFSGDGKMIAGCGHGLRPSLWETATGRKLAEYPGKMAGFASYLFFTPDGKSLLFAGSEGRLRSWHFGAGAKPVDQIQGHKAEVWGLAFARDGTAVFSGSDDHSIKIWEWRHGSLRTTLKGHSALVASLAVSPDGKLLASAGFDRTVRLWALPGGEARAVYTGHTDRVRAVAFSPDGHFLASAGSDKTVRFWDTTGNSSPLVLAEHADTVRALAFDPTGTLLLSASDDRTILGWRAKDGRKAFELPCPRHNSALAFSPDGSILASGDDAGNITFWDVASWSRKATVKGSGNAVWSLAFSPDGRILAAACDDARTRLWDPVARQVVLVLEGHARRVNAVAFSPDGQTLATASHDGMIRLWHGREP